MIRLRPHTPLFIALFMLVALALAAMNSQNNLLFWTMSVLAAVVIVSVVSSHLMMRSLVVRRLDPKHGVVGESLIIQYSITNKSRFIPVFNLHIEEIADKGEANWSRFLRTSRAWVMHIAPRETVYGEAIALPTARGEVRFDIVRCSTTFPFGIIRRCRKSRQETHTLIFPRLCRLRPGILDSIIPSGPLGMKLSSRSGGGDDYFGLREYKPGDSRRQIAWKRSAGSEELIIRERTLPSPPRVRIVLNLTTHTDDLKRGISNGIKPRTLEERAISLAATVIDASAHNGYDVGLTVLGIDTPITPLRKSHWHVERIMGALAAIDLDRPRIEVPPRAVADAERAGIVVIHPARVDPGLVRGADWHFSATQMENLVHRHEPTTPTVTPVMPTQPSTTTPEVAA